MIRSYFAGPVQIVADKSDYAMLEKRIRRALAKGRLRLHKSRGERQKMIFGDYWLTDCLGIMPILRRVDLLSLAKQLYVWHDDLQLD